MRVLLLGYGNPGRGDDGLGPALVETVAPNFPQVAAVVAMQLQPEHVLELANCDLALLADAGTDIPSPFTFEHLSPRRDLSAFSHSLSPWALLAVYQETLKAPPPSAFLLTIAGARFDFGEGLSQRAQQNLEAALVFVEKLVRQPELERWKQACTSCP